MTVIAWDGTTLAADRTCNIGGVAFESTKVCRVIVGQLPFLLAFAGSGARAAQLGAWFEEGAHPDKYPARKADDESIMVVIGFWKGNPRAIRRYEDTGYPLVVESPTYADGAGRDVAMTAMRLGKSAAEAIHVAAEVLSFKVDGLDEVTFG